MKLQAFCVFDIKARAHVAPFFLANVDLAKRYFGQAANDPEHQLYKHPEDFILYHVGEFDDETGKLESFSPPLHLGSALNYIKGR